MFSGQNATHCFTGKRELLKAEALRASLEPLKSGFCDVSYTTVLVRKGE